MPGIAGAISRRNSLDVEQIVKEMVARVRHRGPDGAKVCTWGRVGLGGCWSAADGKPATSQDQMVTYSDDRYSVVCDGEIYNREEIRSELEIIGFRLRCGSDPEVIVAAFIAWGHACLARFNGVWAFALYDRYEGVVFAARDRFGVKPFYWLLTETCLAFGSALRQLTPLLPSVRANQLLVKDFLQTGALLGSEETFFESLKSLVAGCYLNYKMHTDELTIERYYDLIVAVNGREYGAEDEAVQGLRTLLEDAVRLRLYSESRVGTCLSGGLDSSIIALIAAGQIRRNARGDNIWAITAISEDPERSDETFAGEVARAGSLEWIKVRPGYNDFCNLLPEVIRHQEEPFRSPSVCMQTFVMRTARENGITVLLDGQGADGVLGCIELYPALCYALWREEGLVSVLKELRQIYNGNLAITPWGFAAYCAYELIPSVRYWYYRKQSSYLRQPPSMPEWMRQFAVACRDNVRQLQAFELQLTHLPALLRTLDRSSGAYSITPRLPYLDHRIVETAVAMKPELKIGKGWTKWRMRTTMNELLPERIAWRRDKIAFEAPTKLWLARHFNTMITTVESSSLIRRFCDLDVLLRRYGKLRMDQQWRLYSLALWEQELEVGS
jgi:asparagine synthase (glutamine-hydrolysing)